MIKIVLSNSKLFSKISKINSIKNYFSFNLKYLKDLREEDLFSSIIDEIKLPNGSFKTTRTNRFIDLDQEIIKLLNIEKKYKIHDVAVSDGITSIELYNLLKANDIKFDLTISDKYSFIYSLQKWWGTKYYDSQGGMIFFDFLGIRGCSYLSNRFFISKILGMIGFSNIGNIEELQEPKKVMLLNPAVVILIDKKEIEFIEYDIFSNKIPEEKYDLVRCMNILNPKYFEINTLNKGIYNLKESLNFNGILLIGRTAIESGVNNASFFKKRVYNLVKMKDFNLGNEINELVH